MVSFVFLGFLFFDQFEIQKVDQFELESSNAGFTKFVVTKKGDIYCLDYWDSQVVKFDKGGQFKKVIADSGNGPGEVIKPRFIFLMEDETKLLIIENKSRWSIFDTQTDKFIKVITKYLPAVKWEKLDEENLIGVLNNTEDFFIQADLTGEVKKSWGKKPKQDSEIFWSRRFATGLGSNGEVLYQEGAWPEIWIYTKEKQGHEVWELKIPKHYREAPSRPYNLKNSGFVREKLDAHLESFTQVVDFKRLNDKIVVIWEIREPYERSLDIYDFKTRELMIRNFVLPGKRVYLSNDKLYFLELQDAKTEVDKDKVFMHVYKTVGG